MPVICSTLTKILLCVQSPAQSSSSTQISLTAGEAVDMVRMSFSVNIEEEEYNGRWEVTSVSNVFPHGDLKRMDEVVLS